MPVELPERKPRIYRKFLANSRGQGIVEYILVIVVVISIALAIGARLFKPFNEWARNYIGDYVACLLDQGELPSLGGQEVIDGCDASFESFTVANGRPSRENEESRQNTANTGGARQNAAGGVAYRVSGGRSRSAVGSGFDGASGSARSMQTDITVGSPNPKRLSFFAPSGSTIITSGEVQYVGIQGLIDRERDRIRKREDKIRSIAKAEVGDVATRRARKAMPVEIARSKVKDVDIEVGDWSFGGALRIVFIIMIVLALVLFMAGQLAQINKSLEKN